MRNLISVSAIMAILSLPAYATIQSGSTCDTTNLGQSENNSTANVEADWTANTINIDWWTGDEDSDQAYASTTCTYDGTITLPQEPTKTGYTFAGWQLIEDDNICHSYSNQSQCNNGDVCIWNTTNNICDDWFSFCRRASTESACTSQSTILHNAYPQSNISECVWNSNLGTCDQKPQSGMSLLG